MKVIHTRAIEVIKTRVGRGAFEAWQVRASVWLLDTRTLRDEGGPRIHMPQRLQIHFGPDPRSDDIPKEKARAEGEARLRFRLDQGLVGRSYRLGEALGDRFGNDETPSQFAEDHQGYGLSTDQIAAIHPGLRWIVGLPLKAHHRDRPNVVHVVGVLALDGLYFSLSEVFIEELAVALNPEAKAFAQRLELLPKFNVSLDPEPEPVSPSKSGIWRLPFEPEITRVERALEDLEAGDSNGEPDVVEIANRILDFVEARDAEGKEAGFRVREALINQLVRRYDSSLWRHALILAAEELQFEDEAHCSLLRRLLMMSANLYRDLCSLDGRSAESSLEVEREDVLLSALRRGTSLTPAGKFAETVDWLREFLDRKQAPRVIQCAAQCLQNLSWSAPLSEDQVEAVVETRKTLVSLAEAALAGRQDPAPGEVGSVTTEDIVISAQMLNLVQALGMMGDPGCCEIALKATRKFPHLGRSLIRHMKGTIDRWERAPAGAEADHRRVVRPFLEAYDALAARNQSP